MATGVAPRDDEPSLSRTDLESIQEAMKQKKFRDLLAEYCEEIRDPANQAIYQKEMTQLEKERGYDVTFINPKGGYVIKTSVAGDRKAFINICSNENVGKPSGKVQTVDGKRGMNWQVPYSLVPPREDYNDKKERCVIYDVVFHSDTLRMAHANKEFRDLVNKTAIDGLAKTYNIHLDSNNCRFPKSQYKGFAIPSVIRTEDPNYKPPTNEDDEEFSPEILEKLYPQRSYSERTAPQSKDADISAEKCQIKQPIIASTAVKQPKRTLSRDKIEFTYATENGYTIPKYVVKQQKAVDLQDFTYNKDCKQYSAIPSSIVVEINLPLLSSTKDCTLDVKEKSLSIKSENPAKYKLDISLPYIVNKECGNAIFDIKRHMLIVTLPVVRKNINPLNKCSSKIDSGVESEENSGSQSDEENPRDKLIVELSSAPSESTTQQPQSYFTLKTETFLDPSLGYLLPPYTHNVLDDVIAFTFHVKNTEPDSVVVKKDKNNIFIKFTSIGSGFVPVHYAALLAFDESVTFENVTGEAWDNNVILQMELIEDAPQKFKIGISDDSMSSEEFDVSEIKKTSKILETAYTLDAKEENPSPVVEVTNLGSETNIVVSSNNLDELDEDDDIDSPMPKDEDKEEMVWTEAGNCESGAKSILRKKPTMRSFSESSVDVASSMDYISSDCIPEESSLKKTVRFNDVIARQFYRYNSSIEGQKKKNQRKKSKKRNQEQRKSESEAEDEVFNLSKTSRPKLKSAIKLRRDSGLADTSDAEAEADCKNEPTDFESSRDITKLSNVFGDESYENLRSVLNIVDNTDEDDNASKEDEKINKICDNANDKNKVAGSSNDNRTKETVKTVLNIINDKNANENLEPAIWEYGASIPPESDIKVEERKQSPRKSINCDNIKHNTNLYDPEKLNKGHYLEVKFKNDLIFDLDM